MSKSPPPSPMSLSAFEFSSISNQLQSTLICFKSKSRVLCYNDWSRSRMYSLYVRLGSKSRASVDIQNRVRSVNIPLKALQYRQNCLKISVLLLMCRFALLRLTLGILRPMSFFLTTFLLKLRSIRTF